MKLSFLLQGINYSFIAFTFGKNSDHKMKKKNFYTSKVFSKDIEKLFKFLSFNLDLKCLLRGLRDEPIKGPIDINGRMNESVTNIRQ